VAWYGSHDYRSKTRIYALSTGNYGNCRK
jgi:tetratricopeptide (TPR) repeat protein